MPELIAMQSFARSSLDMSKLCSFDQEVIEVPTSPLIHQEARFLFIIDGHGTIRIQNRDIELRPNTLLGILPWQITTVTEVTEPLQYYLLVYNQHMLNRFVKSFTELDGTAINWIEHIEETPAFYCDEGQAARVKQYFASLRDEVGLESILGEAKPKPLGSLAVMNKLVEFIIMIERFRRCAPAPATPESSHDLNEILRYMYCHTSEKLTLKGLSRRFYCSESSISAYITGMTGLSFFDLLNEMRIGKTANYLLYTDLTLEDIASILGYVDSSHISKVFSARVDMRINDYRKTYQRVENICRIEDNRKSYAIIEYIYRNHRDPLSARNVSTKFGITVSELNRLLLIQVERNFEDFLHWTRINKACELLLTTDDTITYIAMEVGYSNTKTFTRNFLRLKVMTPGDFRKSVSLQGPKL
ncbi:MAG: helix-turn-helix transcriptional regulator [Oscillospiraceae bacterium]|nr:helix-turn-helix transcriptional regulator [Oscillospiraceae bacterium]